MFTEFHGSRHFRNSAKKNEISMRFPTKNVMLSVGVGYADKGPVGCTEGRAPGVRVQGAQARRAPQEPRHEAQQIHPQIYCKKVAKER